jgi:signal transduction histidine kinase
LGLLSFPERFIWRLRAKVAPDETRRVERVLASARLFLAVSFLAAIYVLPSQHGYPVLAYLLLVLYIIHSFVVMILARLGQGSTSRFRLLVHGTDIVFPAVVSLFTQGPNGPFFLFFLFGLLAAAYRWGLWETLATAVASVALLTTETVVLSHSAIHWMGIRFDTNADQLLLVSVYLFVMGLLLGYLAENEKQLRAEKAGLTRTLGLARVDLGLTGTLREILGELLRLFASSSALLVVEESHSSKLFACRVSALANGRAEVQWLEAGTSNRENYFFFSPAAAWYATQRSRADSFGLLALNSDGIRIRKVDPSFFGPLLAEHPFRSVLAVALTSSEDWAGRLFLFEPRLPGDREEALRYLLELARQVTPAVTNVYLLRRLRQRAGAIERAHVARELHDGAVQSLISVEMQVDVLRRQAETQPEKMQGELSRIQQLLREEVLKLRDLMQQMKPLTVDPRSLPGFLKDTVAKFERETGISAEFACADAEIALPPRSCRELARIVQEGLVNIRKHSHAHHVVVQVGSENGNCRTTIEDDGRGFDFSGRMSHAELDANHKGPVVIKERVRSVEGHLTIESIPGKGSHLEVLIPYQQPAAHA